MASRMSKAGPAAARRGPDEPDRLPMVAALLAVATLGALLLFEFGAMPAGPEQRPPVTVSEAAPAAGESAPWRGLPPAGGGERLGPRLGAGLVLAQRTVGGRPAGYFVSEATDPALLSEAKLRAGDLLIELDGARLEPAGAAAIGRELASADAVELTFVRDGQVRTRLIDLTR